MSDDFAVFNRVLRRIVKDRNEIISLNRGIPAEKLVAVTITIKTEESLSYLQYFTGDDQRNERNPVSDI